MRRAGAFCPWIVIRAVEWRHDVISSAKTRYGKPCQRLRGISQGPWPCPGPVRRTVAMRRQSPDGPLILDILREDRRERPEHVAFVRVSEFQEIDITGGAEHASCPQREECGSLEHEPGSHWRATQPVQETLVDISRQQQLEVLAALACEIEQPDSDGGSDICRWLCQASASRYGRSSV